MSFHLGKPILVMTIVSVICGGAIFTRPKPQQADLTVWTFADSHYQSFEPLIAPFEQANGLTVNLNLVQARALRIRLTSSFMTGDSENVPDLVEIEIGAIGQFFRPPLRDVGFLDLTDRLKASGWYDRIVQTRFSPWSKEGHIFGVPHDVHPVTITYRDDLFREAGIDLAQAKTWPAFHEACIRFTHYWQSHGQPNRHAIELPAATADALNVILLQRGINLVDDFNRIHLADPQVANTLAFYAQMVAGDGNIASESSGGTGAFTRDLQDGNICAFITPDWRTTFIRRYGINADDPRKNLTGKMRMMPLPVFDPTDTPTSTWGGTMIGIPKACKNPARAWRLLEHLYFSRESLETRRAFTEILPPIKSVWDDPYYHRPDAFFGGQKIDELYTQLAQQIPPRYVTPATNMASATLAYVLNLAVNDVNERGPAGLESHCQTWLDLAAKTFNGGWIIGGLMISRERWWSLQYRFAPYLFIAPFVVLFLMFMLYPLGRSITLSLHKSFGPTTLRFVGIDNYTFLLRDRLFWLAVANTIAYTIIFLLFQIPISLGLALLLNSRRVWFRNVFRFAFFAPVLVGQVFVAVIFSLLLAQRHGLVNRIIGALLPSVGSEINWTTNPNYALPAIIIAGLWLSLGYGMIYFLAALQGVDHELYEAAGVDGAGRWARFWHVTLPGIRPVLVFMILVGTIGAFQLFELPYVLFQGPGPNNRGLTIVMYLFIQGFDAGDIGYASAVGWVLVLMILLVSLAQIRMTRAGQEEPR